MLFTARKLLKNYLYAKLFHAFSDRHMISSFLFPLLGHRQKTDYYILGFAVGKRQLTAMNVPSLKPTLMLGVIA